MGGKYDVVHNERKFWLNFRRTIAYIVLTLLCLLCLFFFYVMLINCTRDKNEIMQSGLAFLPSTHLIENLEAIWSDGNANLLVGMRNSLIVSAGCVFGSVYFSAMTAYGIHVYDFKGRKFAFNFILLIMTIPTQVTTYGFVEMMRGWHLDNSLIPLIIPSIAAPTVFFFMKQYMDSSLPLDIVEAARIDGANEFRTFNSIILPILKPAMAVQAIFTFVSSWNNYFTPSVLITTNKEAKTLPIMIAYWSGKDFASISMGHVYMVITFSILPVVIVYFCLSKFIIGGVTLGAVKG